VEAARRPGRRPLWVIRYMRGPAASLTMSAMPLKAEVNSKHLRLRGQLLRLDGIAVDVIQAPIMRYELSDYEWTVIKKEMGFARAQPILRRRV